MAMNVEAVTNEGDVAVYIYFFCKIIVRVEIGVSMFDLLEKKKKKQKSSCMCTAVADPMLDFLKKKL